MGALEEMLLVTDDDTKMNKTISHAKYCPNGKNNIEGCLPLSIPEPNWYVDPIHRAKCMAGAFFKLTKGKKSATRAHKLDAFRIRSTTCTISNKTRVGGLYGARSMLWHHSLIYLMTTHCAIVHGVIRRENWKEM